jgi:hypothetical protein
MIMAGVLFLFFCCTRVAPHTLRTRVYRKTLHNILCCSAFTCVCLHVHYQPKQGLTAQRCFTLMGGVCDRFFNVINYNHLNHQRSVNLNSINGCRQFHQNRIICNSRLTFNCCAILQYIIIIVRRTKSKK